MKKAVIRQPRPVQPDLELHQQAGDDAHRVVDDVELTPVPHHPQVYGVAAEHRSGLEECDERREPERQRDEQEMRARGEGEQRSGERQGAQRSSRSGCRLIDVRDGGRDVSHGQAPG
jgi:hypothetical protein